MWVAFGSLERRSSSRLANVGHIIAHSIPSSSSSSSRGSGSKKAGNEWMYLGGSSRALSPGFALVLDDGFVSLYLSSWAPGAATTLKVGFGMYSLILFLMAIFVRPFSSTYLIRPEYS